MQGSLQNTSNILQLIMSHKATDHHAAPTRNRSHSNHRAADEHSSQPNTTHVFKKSYKTKRLCHFFAADQPCRHRAACRFRHYYSAREILNKEATAQRTKRLAVVALQTMRHAKERSKFFHFFNAYNY